MCVDERPDHSPRLRSSRGWSALTTLIVLLLLLPSGRVVAHTGFESSSPGDGEVVSSPVDTVTITFTGPATPVGDEFVALDADGQLQEPVAVSTTDDMVFDLRFDPPLAGGSVGIRWSVQAADAHPIEGAFSFTVDAPNPTTTAPEASTAPAPTTVSGGGDTPTSTPASNPTDTALAAAPLDVAEDGSPGTEAGDAVTTTLDEFLASADDATPGKTRATVGRLIGFLGVVLGIGALAFAATTLRGRRDEVNALLFAVRSLGAIIVVGSAIEYVGVTRIGGDSLADGWSTQPGFATTLRILGGLALIFGVAETIAPARNQGVVRRPSVARSLSAAAATETLTSDAAIDGSTERIVRWMPNSRSWPALAGSILIVASFWFDGHTVSKGFRPLHAIVNSVHLIAGSVWVGGVVAMSVIVWTRHRRRQRMQVAELVVRFSKIATIALASVIGAGIVMAFFVLDSFAELTGTEWGKILLLKSAAVGLAIIGGAYNHFRLLPQLEADPESPRVLAQLRSTITAEAIMLVFVVTVTAWLAAAAS